jgi:hypothetical protein
MSRNKSNREIINLEAPAPLTRDQLDALSTSSLEELRNQYALELDVLSSNSGSDPRSWQVELAYIDRTLEKRVALETVTPAEHRVWTW